MARKKLAHLQIRSIAMKAPEAYVMNIGLVIILEFDMFYIVCGCYVVGNGATLQYWRYVKFSVDE